MLINSLLGQGQTEKQICDRLVSHGFNETAAKEMYDKVQKNFFGSMTDPKAAEAAIKSEPVKETPVNIGQIVSSSPTASAGPAAAAAPVAADTPPVYNNTPNGFWGKLAAGKKRGMVNLFFLGVCLLLSVIPSYVYISKYAPLYNDLDTKLEDLVNKVISKDLEVKISKGQASTNVSEPFYITVARADFEQFFPSNSNSSNLNSEIRLLTIDTKGRAEDFEKYQSFYLLTQDSLVYYNEDKINIKSLRNIQNMTINRGYVLSQLDKIKGLFGLANGSSLFMPVLYFGFTIFSNVINILAMASVIWFIIQPKGLKIKFAHIFRFTMFLTGIYLLFQFIISRIPPIAINLTAVANFIIIGAVYSLLSKHIPQTQT